MEIHGLQKMTLLDFPGKVACIAFFGGCDMRCPFCHNWGLATGADAPQLSEQELLDFLRKRTGILEGVVISGGEPLLRDLRPLLRRIRGLGYAIKLDTNGSHSQRLREVVEEDLVDYVAMDIKNSPQHYSRTAGVEGIDLSAVGESIAFLLEGHVDYEFRTTAVAEFHGTEGFRQIGEWIRGARRYFLQPFTDRESVPFAGFHAPEKARLEEFADIVRPFVGAVAIRGE